MFKSVFFLSCCLSCLSTFCGISFSCVKKDNEITDESAKSMIGEQVEMLAKKVVRSALERFDDKADIDNFVLNTGLAVQLEVENDKAILVYRIDDQKKLSYTSGKYDKEKNAFLNGLDYIALLRIAQEKGFWSILRLFAIVITNNKALA